MLFESRVLWHPKDLAFANEYEDSFAIEDRGIVAVADGVSSAIFSRQWSDILTRAVVEQPPDLQDGAGFQNWLVELRAQWRQAVDLNKLNFFQRQRLQQVGGGFSTLLWVELYPMEPVEGEGGSEKYLLRCFAIGDCCLFHLRDGQLLHKFPLDDLKEFDAPPVTIGSVDTQTDHLLEFSNLEEVCLPGDELILSSDALAQWIYRCLEAEEPVDWEKFWEISEDDWHAEVAFLRDLPSDRRMRVDDTTVVLLRLGSGASPEDQVETEDRQAQSIEAGSVTLTDVGQTKEEQSDPDQAMPEQADQEQQADAHDAEQTLPARTPDTQESDDQEQAESVEPEEMPAEVATMHEEPAAVKRDTESPPGSAEPDDETGGHSANQATAACNELPSEEKLSEDDLETSRE